MNEEAAYVLRRSFDGRGHSIYTIWVKEDAIKISSVKLCQLLADTLQGVVKVSDLPKNSVPVLDGYSNAPKPHHHKEG